jgi:hypothetical protein
MLLISLTAVGSAQQGSVPPLQASTAVEKSKEPDDVKRDHDGRLGREIWGSLDRAGRRRRRPIFKIGPQLVNSRAQFWDDVKSSPGYQTWTMQMQFQLLFPKKR